MISCTFAVKRNLISTINFSHNLINCYDPMSNQSFYCSVIDMFREDNFKKKLKSSKKTFTVFSFMFVVNKHIFS